MHVILKWVVSIIIAFIIINTITCLYTITPVRIKSTTGATDFVFEPFQSAKTSSEGYAKITYDENGYNNFYNNFTKQSTNILVMGSSYTNGSNIAQDENFVYKLNKLSEANRIDKYFYNIGMDGHFFPTLITNFSSAVKAFNPTDSVIIEVSSVEYSEEELKSAFNDTLAKNETHESGFMYYVQKIPFARLMYQQLETVKKSTIPITTTKKLTAEDLSIYSNLLSWNLEKLRSETDRNIIIIYHPNLEVDYNGNVKEEATQDYLKIFEQTCKENNIYFLDTYDSFKDYYNETNQLPAGFINTLPGIGHLNKYGQEIVANSLFVFMREEGII